MAINRLLCSLFFCNGALGINFPGLRVPLSRPRTSIYSLESCTDTSSSGALATTVPQVTANKPSASGLSPLPLEQPSPSPAQLLTSQPPRQLEPSAQETS